MGRERGTGGSDIGRRIAQRRSELGMSRAEMAEGAGMDPGYAEYLEEQPARLSQEALYHLAHALGTSPEHLLGADTDTPPGSASTAVPEPETRTLTAEECLALLEPGGVGRVAFTDSAGTAPVVLPVNYVLSDGTVVFRTAADGVIGRHVPGPMGFEVDRIDGAMSEGWSVLVAGRARRVGDGAELAALRGHRFPRPWAGGEREAWIRVEPEGITGRRVGGRVPHARSGPAPGEAEGPAFRY
ncbi:helix-turn-helix domain-containing protein [Nocardiopsis quinghaiensis]|uniref:helix-turn-helix domain-containing protein n=1 Tax=Nocardiopsis quinghaiensis TaxID=464995 RepID=UPI00123BF5BB|nr:pyridoxamine 5'-phosphate oxidase family protein [Nocardiopsis quinghaiensis]